MSFQSRYRFTAAWLPDGWRRNVVISVDPAGDIVDVSPDDVVTTARLVSGAVGLRSGERVLPDRDRSPLEFRLDLRLHAIWLRRQSPIEASRAASCLGARETSASSQARPQRA